VRISSFEGRICISVVNIYLLDVLMVFVCFGLEGTVIELV